MKNLFFQKIFFLTFCFFPSLVFAQGIEVVFDPDPLFSFENFLPGDIATSTILIQNNTSQTQSIYIWAENVTDPFNFGEVLLFEILENSNSLYQESLSQFFSQENIYLSDIKAGQSKEYLLNLHFLESAGNEYQGKSLEFDFWVGFSSKEAPPKGERAVKVVVGGGGVLPQVLEIFNLKIKEITTSSVTITWQTTLLSTSQIIYSSFREAHHFFPERPPLYGYFHIFPLKKPAQKVTFHKITLFNLSPCTLYYFRALSQNSQKAISKEYSFSTLCLKVPKPKKKIEKIKKEEILPPPKKILPPKKEIPPAPKKLEIEIPPKQKPQVLPSPGLWQTLLAQIGSIFEKIPPCFPFWILLILAIFPFFKTIFSFLKFKKEKEKILKSFFKKEAIFWLFLFFTILILNLIFALLDFCLKWWFLLILIFMTGIPFLFFWRKKQKIKTSFSKNKKFESKILHGR